MTASVRVNARAMARDSEAARRRPIVAARLEPCDHGAPPRAPVSHSYAALAFCTAGRSRVEQDGEWTLRAGEVLLVPAGAPHRALERRAPRGWTLTFSPVALDAALLAPLERVRGGASAVVRIPPGRRAYLETLLRELEAAGRAPRPVEAVERSLLTLVLAEVDRAMAPRAGAPSGGVVDRALRVIERGCLGPLTPRDVAAAVGRSAAYVTAALTKATGRSAGKWIVSGRMAEARRLLLHSDAPVELVALRVGYAEVTHFIRMFRREHGVTPAAWRRARSAGGRARAASQRPG